MVGDTGNNNYQLLETSGPGSNSAISRSFRYALLIAAFFGIVFVFPPGVFLGARLFEEPGVQITENVAKAAPARHSDVPIDANRPDNIRNSKRRVPKSEFLPLSEYKKMQKSGDLPEEYFSNSTLGEMDEDNERKCTRGYRKWNSHKCAGAPFLYLTLHGGGGRRRVRNVCKFSRDGCAMGAVLMPSKDHSLRSLRGIMLSGNNLFVAEAWRKDSKILKYSQCNPSLGNKRELLQVLVTGQAMEDYVGRRKLNAVSDGEAGVTTNISSLAFPETLSTSDSLDFMASEVHAGGDADDDADDVDDIDETKEEIVTVCHKQVQHAAKTTPSAESLQLSGPNHRNLAAWHFLFSGVKINDCSLNGLVHPYGFAKRSGDPYIYVSAQNTFTVLRYDMHSGEPGPIPPALQEVLEDPTNSEDVSATHTTGKRNRAERKRRKNSQKPLRRYRLHSSGHKFGQVYDGTFVDLGNDEVRGLAFDKNGLLYVANKQKGAMVFDQDGYFLSFLPSEAEAPVSIYYCADRDSIWVGSGRHDAIFEYDSSTWKHLRTIRHRKLRHPAGLVSHGDILYVVSQRSDELLSFNMLTGELENVILSSLPDAGERIILSPC